MADAYVEDAWTANDKIWVRVIGSNGENTDLHSFKQRDHLAVHHQKTLEYLQSRIGQRAHFAVCMSGSLQRFSCRKCYFDSLTAYEILVEKVSYFSAHEKTPQIASTNLQRR
jgi:hypothetical protein